MHANLGMHQGQGNPNASAGAERDGPVHSLNGNKWPKADGLLWEVGEAKADVQRNGKILLPVAPAIGGRTRCNLKAV